jgi:hypothetical protein
MSIRRRKGGGIEYSGGAGKQVRLLHLHGTNLIHQALMGNHNTFGGYK